MRPFSPIFVLLEHALHRLFTSARLCWLRSGTARSVARRRKCATTTRLAVRPPVSGRANWYIFYIHSRRVALATLIAMRVGGAHLLHSRHHSWHASSRCAHTECANIWSQFQTLRCLLRACNRKSVYISRKTLDSVYVTYIRWSTSPACLATLHCIPHKLCKLLCRVLRNALERRRQRRWTTATRRGAANWML